MTDKQELITAELLRSWNACSDGYRRFCELFPNGADLQTAMDGLDADGHEDWSYWLFEKSRCANMFIEIVSKGYWNTGYRNTGYWNTGDRNTGDRNTGDWNTGDWNTGDRNTGDRNTGDRNTGYWNTGDRNTGDRNTGDWNTGDRNTGFFNTITPYQLLVFNNPCSRDDWEGSYKPDFLFFDITYWVDESEMTDNEKAADPDFYVRGGQLRKKDYKEAFKESWDKADPKDRIRVKELPNFDADVFYEISGIDLRD